jgi:hypothetical protein
MSEITRMQRRCKAFAERSSSAGMTHNKTSRPAVKRCCVRNPASYPSGGQAHARISPAFLRSLSRTLPEPRAVPREVLLGPSRLCELEGEFASGWKKRTREKLDQSKGECGIHRHKNSNSIKGQERQVLREMWAAPFELDSEIHRPEIPI